MRRTARQTLTNPLILGCAGGLALSVARLPLPVSIDRALAMIGGTAAPLGLLSVGGGLAFGKLRADLGAAAATAGVKLVLCPALSFAGLWLLGLRGTDLGVPVLLSACPTAVASYIMAREMQGDAHLAGAIVIGTTVASLFTLPAWLAILGLR